MLFLYTSIKIKKCNIDTILAKFRVPQLSQECPLRFYLFFWEEPASSRGAYIAFLCISSIFFNLGTLPGTHKYFTTIDLFKEFRSVVLKNISQLGFVFHVWSQGQHVCILYQWQCVPFQCKYQGAHVKTWNFIVWFLSWVEIWGAYFASWANWLLRWFSRLLNDGNNNPGFKVVELRHERHLEQWRVVSVR